MIDASAYLKIFEINLLTGENLRALLCTIELIYSCLGLERLSVEHERFMLGKVARRNLKPLYPCLWSIYLSLSYSSQY